MSLAVIGVDGPTSSTDGHLPLFNGPTGKLLKSANYAPREVLTANRSYYVRTDGSDSNNGLANTSGGAFLTIQKALNVVAGLDLNTFNATINVADGTYTGANLVRGAWVGTGNVYLVGNTTTPANCVISVTSNHALFFASAITIYVAGFKVQTTTSGYGLISGDRGNNVLFNGAMEWGACASGHMLAYAGAIYGGATTHTISGAAPIHYQATLYGLIDMPACTVTVSGTPAFSTAFVVADTLSVVNSSTTTFTGSATGKRHDAATNSVVKLPSGGNFPGDSAGSSASGAQVL
jgi:hypothetical protein